MWLFGHWLDLVCHFEHVWWCDGCAKRDDATISMWLQQLHPEKRPGDKGEMGQRIMRELEAVPSFVEV